MKNTVAFPKARNAFRQSNVESSCRDQKMLQNKVPEQLSPLTNRTTRSLMFTWKQKWVLLREMKVRRNVIFEHLNGKSVLKALAEGNYGI